MPGDLVREFRKAIMNISTDIVVEVVEGGIDLLTNSPELIEAIPIANTLLKVVKGTISIRDRLFVIKVANFLNQLHDGTLSKDEYEKYLRRIENDKDYLRNVSKITISQLESFNDEIKAIILGELFKAHIRDEISYPEYKLYSYAINSTNPVGIKYIMELYLNREKGLEPIIGSLLVGTGFVAYSTGSYAGNDGAAYLTQEGRKFCEVVLNKIKETIESI